MNSFVVGPGGDRAEGARARKVAWHYSSCYALSGFLSHCMLCFKNDSLFYGRGRVAKFPSELNDGV